MRWRNSVSEIDVGLESKRAPAKLGGTCAMIVGLLNVLLILYVVATPTEQRNDTATMLQFHAQNPAVYTVNWINLGLTAVLSLAAVAPAVSDLVHSESKELVRATTLLAIVGWAVMALSFLTLIGKTPELAHNYVTGDSVAQKALEATGIHQLDPQGWLIFGGPGIWWILVNVLAWRRRRWPRLLALVGILGGTCYLLTILAAVLRVEAFNLIAAGGGAIVSPVWHLWMGARLLGAPHS